MQGVDESILDSVMGASIDATPVNTELNSATTIDESLLDDVLGKPMIGATPEPKEPDTHFWQNVGRIMEVPFQLPASISQATADDIRQGGELQKEHDYTLSQALMDTLDYTVGVTDISPLDKALDDAMNVAQGDGERAAIASTYALAHMAGNPYVAPIAKVSRQAIELGSIPLKSFVNSALDNAAKVLEPISDMATAIGGQATTKIRNLNTQGSSIIADMIDGQGKNLGFDQATWLKAGESIPDLEDAVIAYTKSRPDLKGGFGVLPKAHAFELSKEIQSGKAVSKEAKDIVSILDKHGDYLLKSGVIDRKVTNWLPRKWNAAALSKDESKSVNMFMKAGFTIRESKNLIQNIINRDGLEVPHTLLTGNKYKIENRELVKAAKVAMTDADQKMISSFRTEVNNMQKTGDPAYQDSKNTLDRWIAELSVAEDGAAVMGKNSSLYERLINLPYEDVAWAIDHKSNLYENLTGYIHSTARFAEFNKRFGTDYSNLNKLVEQTNRQLVLERGTGLAQHELDAMYDSTDALIGNYKPLTDTWGDKTIGLVNKVAVPALHILTLPLATISSISEIVMPLGRAALRPSAALKGMGALTMHLTHSIPRALGLKSIPKHDATRAVEELGIGLDAGIVDMMMQLHKGDTSAVSSLFFKANLLHGWTRAMMVSSNATGKAMIQGHLKDILAGRGNVEAYKKDLTALGVDWKAGTEWIKAGATKDHPFYQRVREGGLHFVTDTVMMPRSSVLPIYAANPRVKLIMQLKSFPMQFGNTVLHNFGSKLVHGTAKEKAVVGSTVAMATSLGMLATGITDQIRYQGENPRHKDWEAGDYMLNGFERFGGLGALGFAKDAYSSSEYGSDPLTTVAGPFASFASGSIKAGYKAINTQGDWAKPVATQMARMSPIANVTKESRSRTADIYHNLLTSDDNGGWQ